MNIAAYDRGPTGLRASLVDRRRLTSVDQDALPSTTQPPRLARQGGRKSP